MESFIYNKSKLVMRDADGSKRFKSHTQYSVKYLSPSKCKSRNKDLPSTSHTIMNLYQIIRENDHVSNNSIAISYKF